MFAIPLVSELLDPDNSYQLKYDRYRWYRRPGNFNVFNFVSKWRVKFNSPHNRR